MTISQNISYVIPDSQQVSEIPLDLLQAGISIIPIKLDGSKAPAVRWKEFQSRIATEAEIQQWFSRPAGIAVVCGRVSKGLVCLDFDDPTAYDEYIQLAEEHGLGNLVAQLPMARTPSNGRHLYFRTSCDVETEKLALDADGQVRIETRAEGAYAIIPPSPAEVHLAGKPYVWERGTLLETPTLSAEEAEDLLALARMMDRSEPEQVDVDDRLDWRYSSDGGERPGDIFNSRDWQRAYDLLIQHGWTVHANHSDRIYLTRPGKRNGLSATWFKDSNTFYCFSSNARPFEARKAYSPFAVYALLEHNGDFNEAAKALSEEYGLHKRNGFKSIPDEILSKLPESAREVVLATLEAAEAQQAGENAKSLSELRQWVRSKLSSKLKYQDKLEIGERVSELLSEQGRLLFERTTEESTPYMVADDGTVLELDEDSLDVQVEFAKAGFNPDDPIFGWLINHLRTHACIVGRQVEIARWKTIRNGSIYISCGRQKLVRFGPEEAKTGRPSLLPNGADGVLFRSDACI